MAIEVGSRQAAAPGPWHAAPTLAEKAQKLRIVDTDIHNDVPLARLKPYLACYGPRLLAPNR